MALQGIASSYSLLAAPKAPLFRRRRCLNLTGVDRKCRRRGSRGQVPVPPPFSTSRASVGTLLRHHLVRF